MAKSVRRSPPFPWLWLLDILAIVAWGILLIKYWRTGEINVLLHPDYVWLAYSAGFFLLGLGAFRLVQGVVRARGTKPLPSLPHMALFPPGWSSGLLLVVALFGLAFSPQPFASSVALDRGLTDSLTLTRSQPQAFRSASRPENKSLIDWIRTLNVYPEPDAYQGQPVNISGFVVHQPNLSDSYLTLSRFIITCCAADAYPVGLPVKLSGSRSAYKPDMWLKVEGSMTTETLAGRRQLVVVAKTLTEIPKPVNPYDY